MITAGFFKFGFSKTLRGKYSYSEPVNDIDDAILKVNMAKVEEIANDPQFLKVNGLQNNVKAQEAFFDLVENQLTPVLSNKSGPAVGILNVKQADGSIKTVWALALPKNASDFTIAHELSHIARQAASKTSSKGVDLFLYEATTLKFDPAYWQLFLREESSAHIIVLARKYLLPLRRLPVTPTMKIA